MCCIYSSIVVKLRLHDTHVGTIAEGAPIIPISAQLKYNIDAVCEYVVKKIPVPIRDFTSEPRLIGEFKAANICSSRSVVDFTWAMWIPGLVLLDIWLPVGK